MTKLELDKANQWTKLTNELKRTQQLSLTKMIQKKKKNAAINNSTAMTSKIQTQQNTKPSY